MTFINEVSRNISDEEVFYKTFKIIKRGFPFISIAKKAENNYCRPISTYLNSVDRPQHEALGNKPHKLCSYSPEPRTDVYCFRLNFNMSKRVYSKHNIFVWFVRLQFLSLSDPLHVIILSPRPRHVCSKDRYM